MTNASSKSARYARLIAENPEQKIQMKRKTYGPVAFVSRSFFTAKVKMSVYSKEFLAIYKAVFQFAHTLREAAKLPIVSTDNCSVTRFFRTKAIPHSQGNAFD